MRSVPLPAAETADMPVDGARHAVVVNADQHWLIGIFEVAGARDAHHRNFALFPSELLCVPVLEELR